MNNDVAGIDQHPVARGQAFNAGGAKPILFDAATKMVGDGADLALGAAAGYDHMIGDRAFSEEVDDDNVFSLVVFQRLSDNVQ